MDESVKLSNTTSGNRSSNGIFEERITASPCFTTAVPLSAIFPLNADIVQCGAALEKSWNLQHEVWLRIGEVRDVYQEKR